MKLSFAAFVVLALATTGCVINHSDQSMKGWDWKSSKEAPPPPPAPVGPGQVASDNAHAVSQALWDEMDRQAQNELLAPSLQAHPDQAPPKKK